MKYIPVELKENVNVSRTHPLAELAWLLGGVLAILALVYLLLGWGVDLAAERIPIKAEVWLGEQALGDYPSVESAALQARLDALLAELPADDPLHQYPFRAHLLMESQVNALAMPGGNILVFSGLLGEIESENELSMILAHELGHYAQRDHLKGLGRGFGLTFATSLIFGQQSGVTELVSQLVMSFQARYSQQQEAAADAYALQLLVKRYGHAGGASDFFTRLAKKSGSRWGYLLASHPHPQARIDKLQQRMAKAGYRLEEVVPRGDDLLEVPQLPARLEE